MKNLLTALVLMITTTLFGQTDETYQTFVYESNLPDEISEYYKTAVKFHYSIRTELNPFYLRGDFDGDKKQDYAISIIEKATNKKGILILHTGTKIHYVIGAGQSLKNGNAGDDYSWMDAWKVYIDKNVEIGAGETDKIILKGEAILVMKLESASGLIYWTGKEYKWYQQGD